MAALPSFTVCFHNTAGFNCTFNVQWNGGESPRTSETSNGETACMDISTLSIPDGTSCWARAFIDAGPNHDSGGNFNYSVNGGSATYSISGATIDPSFNGPITADAVEGSKAKRFSQNPGKPTPKEKLFDDQTAGQVIFFNSGGFCAVFDVEWNGGSVGDTPLICNGQQTLIDLRKNTSLTLGTSCWARVHVSGGCSDDSARNFTFDPNSPNTVNYTVTGGTQNPHFD